MKSPLSALALVTLLLAPAGCISDDAIGCDFRNRGDNPEPRCQERSGIQASEVFGATCDSLGGESLDGGCPEAGLVAGCEIGDDVVDWYYEPFTTAEIQQRCADEGSSFVTK